MQYFQKKTLNISQTVLSYILVLKIFNYELYNVNTTRHAHEKKINVSRLQNSINLKRNYKTRLRRGFLLRVSHIISIKIGNRYKRQPSSTQTSLFSETFNSKASRVSRLVPLE